MSERGFVRRLLVLFLLLGAAAAGYYAGSRRSAETLGSAAVSQRDEYLATARARIESIEERIGRLEQETRQTGGEARARIEERIGRLKGELASLRGRLRDLQVTGESTWERTKGALDASLAELEAALDR